jgi:steroid delta-isomerase-like uncharacterized protein
MSSDMTFVTMQSYLDVLFSQGDFAPYLADNVTFEIVGTPQRVEGKQAVRDLITYVHMQAFDAHPKAKNVIAGDGHAVLEADFIGTHIGNFLDIPGTGRVVNVPYCMVYEWNYGKITAMRNYTSMELFVQQLTGPAPQ